MRSFVDVAEHVLALSKASVAERESRVRAEVGDGDVWQYLARHYPVASDIMPKDLTLDAFLFGSSDDSMNAAAERLRLCASCNGKPARCASRTDQLLEVGLRPVWSDGIDTERCKLFTLHTLRSKLAWCGVPKGMLDCSLDSFDVSNELQRRAIGACRRYLDSYGTDPQRNGLTIAGEGFGIGKTHLAIAVLRELFVRGISRRPYMIYVPAFMDAIRRSYDEPKESPNRLLMDKAVRADVLVLDDLGAERTTDWVQEQLLIIFNARWSSGYATIVTTNALPKEIKEAIGERAYSRLWGCMGHKVLMQGEDRRRG